MVVFFVSDIASVTEMRFFFVIGVAGGVGKKKEWSSCLSLGVLEGSVEEGAVIKWLGIERIGGFEIVVAVAFRGRFWRRHLLALRGEFDIGYLRRNWLRYSGTVERLLLVWEGFGW
jgi:hypothetical protein